MKKLFSVLLTICFAATFIFGATMVSADYESSNSDLKPPRDIEEVKPIDAKLYVLSYGQSVFQSGEVVTVPMTIASRISEYASDIRFSISGTGEYADMFSLEERTGWYDIGYFSDKVNVSPTVRIGAGVPDGRYKLNVNFQYADAYGNDFTSTDVINVTVAGRSANTPYIKNAEFTAKEIGKENKAKLNVNIVNPMSASIWSVNVAFDPKGSEGFSLYQNTLPVQMDSISAKKSSTAPFYVYVGSNVATGNYPMKFNISYKDAGGRVNTLSQTIYVQVTRASDVGNDKSNQPRIIVSNYSTDVKQIQAGKGFTLNFSLQNTSSKDTVSNVKVVLGSVEAPNPGATAAVTSRDVFFPAEGSNSFFIDKIAPKQSASKTIKLMTSQDVEPGVYAVSLTIDYEGGTGGPWNAKEEISFPVNQEQRLDIQGFNVPPDGMSGAPIPIQFQYINKGKSIIYNFSISVEGDFTLDGGDTYIGNLTAGYNDTFDGSVLAKSEGEQKGAIVFKYENSKGEPKEERKEFSINVSPMDKAAMGEGSMIDPETGMMLDPETGMPIDPQTGMPMAKQGGSPILWIVIGVVVVVAVIIALVIIKKKRRAKKELIEDEED